MKTRYVAAGLSAILVLAMAVPALGSSAPNASDGAAHDKLAQSRLILPARALGARDQSTASSSSPEPDAQVSYWDDMSRTEKARANWYSDHCTFAGPNGEVLEGEILPTLDSDAPDSGVAPSAEVLMDCDGTIELR
jgi:hypothetical protein